jgi:uncharacterized protein
VAIAGWWQRRARARLADVEDAARLEEIVRTTPWLIAALRAARDVGAPDWLLVAGALRTAVWDRLHGVAGSGPPADVDLAFFDARDLTPERDAGIEQALRARAPSLPWEAKNQAAVHLWYPRRFGLDVEAFGSIHDAVASWPETAAAVAVRLAHDGFLRVCAPLGLDDLLDGVWRRNPTRVTEAEYRRRLKAKRPQTRWPGVRVLE